MANKLEPFTTKLFTKNITKLKVKAAKEGRPMYEVLNNLIKKS